MSALLQKLYLAPVRGKAALSGLVSVHNDTLPPESIAEVVARREAGLLQDANGSRGIGIDYIFFRRFSDGRSPQVAAFVLDNSDNVCTRVEIAELHRRVWLNGTAPLLYVEWPTKVDILRPVERERQAGHGAWASIWVIRRINSNSLPHLRHLYS